MKQWLFYGFSVGVFAFSVIMLDKIIPYLGFERALNFLGTKPDEVLDNLYFRIAFYVHITSSLLVMITGLLQFFPQFLQKNVAIHRNIGKIYVVLVLIFAAPSGFILSIYANAGLSPRVAFILQSILWWIFTYVGLRAIWAKKFRLHTEMMIRSYALTLAAMSLRLESYVLYYFFETKPIETYLVVTWLSWVGNLLIAEFLIQGYHLGNKMLKSFKKIS